MDRMHASLPKVTYSQRIEVYLAKERNLQHKLRFTPWIRLICFVVMILMIIWFTQIPSSGYLVAAGLALIAFIVTGIVDQRWKESIRKWQLFQNVNRQEISALEGKYEGFPEGTSYLESNHPFAIDLDLFGKGSLFQYISRTTTVFGEQLLASWLSDPLKLNNEIADRQQAIRELSGLLDFRQQFRVIFLRNQASGEDLEKLNDWLSTPPGFRKHRLWRFMAFLIPAITFLSLGMALLGLLPYQIFVFLVLLQLFLVFSISRTTMKEHQSVTRQVDTLRKYAKGLELIQETHFITPLLAKEKQRLGNSEGKSPPEAVLQLSRLLNWMDANLNMVASVFLNGLLMFNIHILMAVEQWKRLNQKQIPLWFKGLAMFDALNSLGNLSFNNPDFAFPDAVSGNFLFDGRDLGHPLISRHECVTNDLQIQGWHQLLIITGANMSGKSTSLRTIGVNMILGMVGAPVFASYLKFTPVQLYSCIRTNDSRVKRESYFYAELKRRKQIIDYLKEGRPTFLLLDEILRGTNSQDKQAGSMALIRQLLQYQVSGMVATHDLALGELKQEEPDHIHNYCFEIEIVDQKMKLDYRLRPGVCQNLNASYLMKKMGIIALPESE